jgi:hypothetical protein
MVVLCCLKHVPHFGNWRLSSNVVPIARAGLCSLQNPFSSIRMGTNQLDSV